MATVNPWKRFIGLLPGGERTVGTVSSINQASGISIVQLRNGTEIAARGVDRGGWYEWGWLSRADHWACAGSAAI